MSDPYIGEIRLFAGDFPPEGWAFCNGQLLQIAENDALFSLIGTIYGGDGQETFALPDLRGRLPLGTGQGPGLSDQILGQSGGQQRVPLSASQMPAHNHRLRAGGTATTSSPQGAVPAQGGAYRPDHNSTFMHPDGVTPEGAGTGHGNMQPFLTVSFIISLFGIYPSQT